ncbi:hypothetical protein RI444_15375 [Paenarthrobacter sp. AT5]|uniref:hypothetical protein n=1 Tax=Paenarthrobacter TaxID=1742992 RepID=UPI001A97E0D9|nr:MULTISPECIES: hypothetical protein [Paenarthrobacter]QSZ53286.1 hypothetical protein AYX19_09895 [Paenarthrobacter ureafaciens]WOC59888.1 hypothetical protein RI444_15375 [Paenarthrobacter sp. AT5]
MANDGNRDDANTPDILAYASDRMIGSALDIDPSPEFHNNLRATKARSAKLDDPNYREGPEHAILGARQEGKTRLAMKWLMQAPAGVERVLVVIDGHQADHLKWVHEMPKNDPRIIGYRTLLNQGPRPGVEYGVDDTVHILTALLKLKDTPHLLTVGHAEAWQGRKNP